MIPNVKKVMSLASVPSSLLSTCTFKIKSNLKKFEPSRMEPKCKIANLY